MSVGETEVFIHPSILISIMYAWLTGHLFFMLISLTSVLLHELGHAIISVLLGQRPMYIEITPIGAVMRLEDEKKLSVCRRILVIAAGPAVSFCLCWLSSCIAGWQQSFYVFGRILFLSNLALLMINLLPVFPLDGGRMLLLLFETVTSPVLAVSIMKIISRVAGFLCIILNIYFSYHMGGWNFSLAFAGCCILYSTSMLTLTQAMRELRYFLERKTMLEKKRCVKTRWYTVLHTLSIRQLVRNLPHGKLAMYVCVEEGTGRKMGIIHESDLIQIYMAQPGITICQAIDAKKHQNLY